MSEAFMRSRLDHLEDFWHRDESALAHHTTYSAYGYPVRLSANDPRLLKVGLFSAGRYSRCAPIPDALSISFSFVMDRRLRSEPVPADWPSRLRYTGVGQWLAVNGEPWVNSFADLQRWIGVAFVSASLMEQPRMLSRFIGDCFVLNMLMRTGWGQLHASCLYRDGRALLLHGRHNAGKSTTAFRLAMNGYRLVSDGMTYVRRLEQGVELLGYPVGEVKLRLDMLEEFRQVKVREAALVREDTKMVYDLRQEMPERVVEEAIRPQRIVLCLLERTGRRETTAERIASSVALDALLSESTFRDDMEVLVSNLESIQALLAMTDCYHLRVGTDVKGIVDTVDSLQ